MQPCTMPLSDGTARVLSRSQLDHIDAWKTTFRDKCKDHRFYEIIAQTLETEFRYQYLVLEDSAGRVRAIQPFFFVRQNVCEGFPEKCAALSTRCNAASRDSLPCSC